MKSLRKFAAATTARLLTLLILTSCAKPAPATALTASELLRLGEKYLLELNYEQAIVQFLAVIEIEPMNYRAYIGAAEAHLALGDTEAAIAVLEQGLTATGNAEIADMLEWLQPTMDATETPEPTPESTPEPTPEPTAEPTPAGRDIPQWQLDMPAEVQQFYRDMSAAFERKDRETVVELLLGASDTVRKWKGTEVQRVSFSFNAQSPYAAYYGLNFYIEASANKMSSHWSVADITNGKLTGLYESSEYFQGQLSTRGYCNIVNGLYEGTSTYERYSNGVFNESYESEYVNGQQHSETGELLREGIPFGTSKNDSILSTRNNPHMLVD